MAISTGMNWTRAAIRPTPRARRDLRTLRVQPRGSERQDARILGDALEETPLVVGRGQPLRDREEARARLGDGGTRGGVIPGGLECLGVGEVDEGGSEEGGRMHGVVPGEGLLGGGEGFSDAALRQADKAQR